MFENPEFGNVRTLETEGGKVLFCASDIASALGYAKPQNAIQAHCKGVAKYRTLTNGGKQSMTFIPEGDVYRLITHSKLPNAEHFERWIFDEVIPCALTNKQRNGGLIDVSIICDNFTNGLCMAEKAAKDYDGFVYIVDVGDSIKIGCTSSPCKRFKQLSTMFNNYAGKSIRRIAVTVPHLNYRSNEKLMHMVFDCMKIANGELFNVPFEDAVFQLKKLNFNVSDIERDAMRKNSNENAELIKNALISCHSQAEPIAKKPLMISTSFGEMSGRDATTAILRTIFNTHIDDCDASKVTNIAFKLQNIGRVKVQCDILFYDCDYEDGENDD